MTKLKASETSSGKNRLVASDPGQGGLLVQHNSSYYFDSESLTLHSVQYGAIFRNLFTLLRYNYPCRFLWYEVLIIVH